MVNDYYDSWDNYDEDAYPAGDDRELEYEEDWEDEEEEYDHQYSAIQGNWNFEDLENEDSFQKIGRQRVRKVQSVKTYDAIRKRERQNQQKKIRNEAKAREKQRQKYYHYGEENEDEE